MSYHRVFWQCLCLLLSLVTLGRAGTTGKIAGQVVDKATGEPLAAATVTIKGTMLGAAADLNGHYTILFIPPGTYEVEAAMMGYGRVLASEVRVRIDQTSPVDFQLSAELLTGEEVTVLAERNIIKRDVATSVVAVESSELRALPFNSVTELVGLQAGVEEDLSIRGAEADEALFQVDGITLRDPRNNEPITGIALTSIKELSLERGGFNAEYGQVRSGIINIVTHEGDKDRYSGAVILKYSAPQQKYFGVSPFDENSMWLKPYLDPDVAFVGTQNGAWDQYTQRQYPVFAGWNAVSNSLLTDSDPTNDLSPEAAQRVFRYERRRRPVTDQPDYNVDASFGGPVPFVSRKLGNLRFFTSYRREREMLLIPLSRDDYFDYNWSLQVTSDLKPSMKLKLTSLVGKSYNVAINGTDNTFNDDTFGISGTPFWQPTDYIRTPFDIAKVTAETRPGRIFVDSWYSHADVSHVSLAGQFTHVLNPKTFYEARVEHLSRKYETGPIRDRNEATLYEIVPGYFASEAPFGFSAAPNTGVDGMFFGGHTATSRDSSSTSATTMKIDLTSQLNFNNLVKTGLEFVYYDMGFDYGLVNLFFGDINYVKETQNPYRAAFYLQDKLETKGFILNAGLRLDYSTSNIDWVRVDQFDRSYFSSRFNPNTTYPTEPAEKRFSLSPRFAISHPITENSKLFFNYGHFKQLPTYEELFRVGRGTAGRMRNYGDPDLLLARTVSYELGYDHVLFSNYLLQLAGFYHDITDQQNFTTYVNADGSVGYSAATSNSYEDIRGFELSLRKSHGRWFRGFANYTYQVNTRGQFGRTQVFENPSDQLVYDRNTRNLYQTRPEPRPFARASVFFNTPDEFGPSVLGLKPLEGWELNLIGDWKAGDRIVWNPFGVINLQANVTVRDYSNFILRLNKGFDLGGAQFTFFMEIENLFDTKRLSGASFYDNNDFIFYMRSLHLPASDEYNNIVGEDKAGDFREDDVAFQPIEPVGVVDDITNPNTIAFYFERTTGRYMQYANGAWTQVDQGRLQKVLDDKAYIDMPNQTSFSFLLPRQVFFGIRTTFGL